MEGLLDLWGLPPFFVALINSTLSTAIGIWIGYDAGKRKERLRQLIEKWKVEEFS